MTDAGAAAAWIATALLLASLTLGASCRRASAPPAGAPWPVVFHGCEAVLSNARCALPPDRALRLWVPGEAAPGRRLRSNDGGLPLPPAVSTGDGLRYVVTVPAGLSWLALEERGSSGRRVFTLHFAEDPWPPALAEALKAQRRHEDARTLARLEEAAPQLSAGLAARARGLRARVALWRGQADEAIAELRGSREALLRAGRVSDALNDGFAAAYALIWYTHRLGEARALLDTLAPLLDEVPGARSEWHLYEGQSAFKAGDFRGALRSFQRSAVEARRLGLSAAARHAESGTAQALADLGRADEAVALQRRLVEALEGPDATDELPCTRLVLRHNLAWYALLAWLGARDGDARREKEIGAALARARQEEGAASPGAAARASPAGAAAGGCPDPSLWRNGRITAALFALETGDRQRARVQLDELRGEARGRAPALSIWEVELDGRLALAEGQAARALALFERQAGLAEAAVSHEGAYRAEVGRGLALLALGRAGAAVERFRAAEALLAGWLAAVPLGEGRDHFLAVREQSARLLVQTLVTLGRPAEAFTAARAARARLLRATSLAERIEQLAPSARARWLDALSAYRRARSRLEAEAADDWRLAATELETARGARRERELALRAALDEAYRVLGADAGAPARPAVPGPGELFLGFAPTATGGWLGFAATAAGAVARSLGPIDPAAPAAAIADKLWRPFDLLLGAARRVRLFPHATLEAIDLHALPWRGEPLAIRRAVAYGLDLGARPRARGGGLAPALLVADPALDLPAARLEVDALAALLGPGRSVALVGRAATRDAILSQLPRHRVFHYAGHGTFGGLEGMDSALVAADAARIRLGDVLALPTVPPLVVLSACDAGRGAAAGGSSGLGLGHAFLAAGADAVIAAVRPVADAAARAFMVPLYRELSAQVALDPAEAARRAAGELRARSPALDWASFRVLVP